MTKIIVANWKMNLNLAQSVKLAKEYKKLFKKIKSKIVACPSDIALLPVKQALENSKVMLGAQNVSSSENGPHTGEVSAKTLMQVGCKYIIIGHSERRAKGESCKIVNAKLKIILKTKNIIPIICIGEDADKRKAGKSDQFLAGQLKRALEDIKTKQRIIVAYEPIWAIGTGNVIKPNIANKQHKQIKDTIIKILGKNANFKVIYGGSVKAKNAKDLLILDNIDGFLVGGASLVAKEFYKIANIK